jgi:hypothetical protein
MKKKMQSTKNQTIEQNGKQDLNSQDVLEEETIPSSEDGIALLTTPEELLRVIESVLKENDVSYSFYTKPLSSKAQQRKFITLCSKKPKHVFIVSKDKKSQDYFRSILSLNSSCATASQVGLDFDEDEFDALCQVCFRGETRYFVYSELEEEFVRQELYDEIVLSGNPNICVFCQQQIKSQPIKCVSCKEAKLCTFCFTKRVLAENNIQCESCEKSFVEAETKTFMDEMIGLYQKNPRDLFTTIQKRKKELPPGLKNLGQIVQSALKEAKKRGDPLPTQLGRSLPRNVNI